MVYRVCTGTNERLVKTHDIADISEGAESAYLLCTWHGILSLNKCIYIQDLFQDWTALIRLLSSRPTHAKELVATTPSYSGACDASRWGVGGVWFGINSKLPPTVWFLQWPDTIRHAFDNNNLTISDMELAGILLHWIVLEHLAPNLHHKSAAIWCDNLPAVNWCYKLRSSSSPVAAALLRALAMRLHTQQASPITIDHISGTFNLLADTASRKHSTNPHAFLSHFTQLYPPPPNTSWTLFQLPTATTLKLYSTMLTQQSNLASWRRLTKKGAAIGMLGTTSSMPTFPQSPPRFFTYLDQHNLPSWEPSPNMFVKEAVPGTMGKFEPKESKWRCPPSQRPSNWQDNQIPWLTRKGGIPKASVSNSNPIDEKTPPPTQN